MYRATIKALVFMLLFASCATTDIERIFLNANLEHRGIRLKFHNIPEGMYKEPFTIPFGSFLDAFSGGKIKLDAYNTYTVGNYEKDSAGSMRGVTNFIDPTSRFKDTWFGVCIIFDDADSRKFMLKDSRGDPCDFNNFRIESVILLPEMDQKIILWSTHQNQSDYSWGDFESEFFFYQKKGSLLKTGIVADREKRLWYRISGDYDTIAALTDTSRTKMELFSSIRNYIGLPDERVYREVTPWHRLTIRGRVNVRYFHHEKNGFWAVVYYNGCSFTRRDGIKVDTWDTGGLQKVLDTMFETIEIGNIKY